MKASDDSAVLCCDDIANYCFDYLGGALPDHERRLFSSHLRNCPECMRFFETYRRTPQVSREALGVTMPDRVRVAVHEFLRSRCGEEAERNRSSSR